MKTERWRAADVAEDALHERPMVIPRSMHAEADLLHDIRNQESGIRNQESGRKSL
jgi:hypothetical protein